jgi:hypothetical protein
VTRSTQKSRFALLTDLAVGVFLEDGNKIQKPQKNNKLRWLRKKLIDFEEECLQCIFTPTEYKQQWYPHAQ